MTDIVFIPALLSDEALYKDVIAALPAGVTAHVLQSPKPSLTDSAADILARAPEKFALVGTSYGGNLALEVALTAPERVTALWLMGCDPGAPAAGGPDLAGGLAATPDAVIGMLAGLVVKPAHTAAVETFKQMAARVGGAAGSAQAQALATRQEQTSRLDALHMPVLCLWGEEDAICPASVGLALSRELPHAHFVAIPDCGHLPTLEKPAESGAAFAAFLDGETHGH